MNFKIFILGLVSTLILSGCFSLEHCQSKRAGVENVVVSNYGWQIFGTVPIFCGNATSEKNGRVGEWAFFRDDVTLEKVQARFMEYVNSTGREVSDVSYHNYSSTFFTVPFTSVSIPLPYIVCYKEILISGVLK